MIHQFRDNIIVEDGLLDDQLRNNISAFITEKFADKQEFYLSLDPSECPYYNDVKFRMDACVVPALAGSSIKFSPPLSRQSRRGAPFARRDVLPTARPSTLGKPEIGRRELINRITPPEDRGTVPHHVPSGPRLFS